MIGGSIIATWAGRAETPLQWYRDFRAWRGLAPLWRALHDAVPGIALDSPNAVTGTPHGPRSWAYRLYRRVTEIRDAQLALRPYMDSTLRDAIADKSRRAGHDTMTADAAGEAAMLRDAICRKAADTPATSPPETLAGEPQFSADVAWLTAVSRAYRNALDQALPGRNSSGERLLRRCSGAAHDGSHGCA